MASGPGISDDPESIVVENTIFVAVGKDVNKYQSLLSWAMQNSGGKRICILIVDQPTRWINILGAKTPISSVREEMATEAQEKRRQRTREIANQYTLICGQRGAQAQKLLREGDCVKKEIVEVIRLHKIKHLVMGSELRRYCTRMDLKSDKARYVREKAPVFCHIHFVCRGNIIVVREASAETEPSSPTSVVDIICNYEEQDGSMFRTHSSALLNPLLTIQQVMTEFPERRGHMGQEAEEEIGGRWEELKELIQRLTEAALKREEEVHEIRSQFAALQDKVDELQVERDNLLTEVQGRMLG